MLDTDINILRERAVLSQEYFSRENPEVYKRVCEYSTKIGATEWKEMKYLYMNQIKERPVCKVCGKPVIFQSVRKGYTDTCCRDCDKIYKAKVQKQLWANYTEEEKNTRLEHAAEVVKQKTGYRTPFANPEIREKIKLKGNKND